MPLNCDEFLKKVKKKKVYFALLGKGTAWKFYPESEATSLVEKGNALEEKLLFTGKASWEKTKYKFAIDGDKIEAKKALKAAFIAEKIKWDESAIAVVGKEEDEDDGAAPTQAAAPTPKAAAPARPQTAAVNPAAAAPARPQTAAVNPAAAAPARPQTAAVNPAAAAPARPQTAAVAQPLRPAPPLPNAAERDQFKGRIQKLMPQLQDVATFNPKLLGNVNTIIKSAGQDPVTALRLLDGVEKELEKIGKENRGLLMAANHLRADWEKVTSEGLETESILTVRRAAVLDALKKKDPKAALKALLELQNQIKPVQDARDESRRLLVGRWNLRQPEDPSGNRLMTDREAQEWEDKVARLAKEFQLPEPKARELLESAFADLQAQARALKQVDIINPIIPPQSRPELSAEERMEVCNYVGGNYNFVNPPLWKNQIPLPPYDEMHKQLQEAFKKTKPFPTPIRVKRGMKFEDAAELNAYLQPFKDAMGTDKLVPLMGYISTGTVGTPPDFEGNIEFTIIAKQGLDMTPYAGGGNVMMKEKELCLNHGTLVKVHRVKPLKSGIWQVHVEQILLSDNG